MSLFLPYCNAKYYGYFDSSAFLSEVQNEIDPSIATLTKEFQNVFHHILNTDPCSYWDKNVYTQTVGLLENMYQAHSSQLCVDEIIFHYFLMGYNAYSQISETMLDLRNFNLSQEMKTRLYRLPIYTSILESCLSNFLRVIATLTGQSLGKDYSVQNTLGQLMDVIRSNGYSEIDQRVNVNIRNAINHGKVRFKKDPTDNICFYYTEQRIQKCTEMPFYEFDKLIDDAFDAVSAVLLALVTFFNGHLSILQIDETKKEYVPFTLLSMRLSIPGICCQNISDVGNTTQINVDVEIANTDRGYIAEIGIYLAAMVHEKYPDYDVYMISFSNPRMLTSWIRFKNQEIVDMRDGVKTLDAVIKEVIDRKDFMVFPPSEEEVDLNEIKYFCFPNYYSSEFKVNNVQDASVNDRKRLRAHIYIGNADDRNQILSIINQAIQWLLTLKNPPSPVYPHKYGDVPADALYINVYRNDGRKNKELYTSNDNFVCFVDFNQTGETTLENGGLPKPVWDSLSHEKVDNMYIAWRESKYLTRHVEKVGRNDPCPCGSGRKYKKCCGRST